MNDKQSDAPTIERENRAPRPIGAILVTVFLAAMILISWFGMYFLNFARG